MSPTSEVQTSPQTLSSALARSRSRYKGPRPNKTKPSLPPAPETGDDQVQRLKEGTVVHKPKGNDHSTSDGSVDKRAPFAADIDSFPTRLRTAKVPRADSNATVSDIPNTYLQSSEANQERQELLHQVSSVERNNQHSHEIQREHRSTRKRLSIEGGPQDDVQRGHHMGKLTQSCTMSEMVRQNGSFYKVDDYRQPDTLADHNPVQEQPTIGSPLALPKKSFTQRITGNSSSHHCPKAGEELKRTISAPIAIETPQSAVIPAFDAPISAVNAGERKVNVQYGQSVIFMPIIPTTTPRDIIRSAADQLSQPMDAKNTVLLESFKQLGLERPLRRYEHIRDVMNSWDNDASNTLVIVPSPTGGRDDDLDINNVSPSQPGDTSVSIYHSQKPGHWDKRWITLRSDGQVLVAKKDGGETVNICHLSDFDIYVPTARQLAKKIKPPKKVCFAVKSQQKSSMFLSTANFVHFFSTSDRALATSWYKAIQEWKSWYLVNVMGEGCRDSKTLERRSMKRSSPALTNSIPSEAKYPSRFSAELRHQPKPLSTAKFEEPVARPARFVYDPEMAADSPRTMPIRKRGVPPVSYPNKLTKDITTSASNTRNQGASLIQSPPTVQPEPEPFATTGLLGRTYTQRRKAQLERESHACTGPLEPSSIPTTNQKNGLKRTSSQRPKTRPLVDLTPQYQEPPQHSRKGRGVIPEQIPAGGLVEVATSPEAAIPIPPTTTWRRPTSSGETEADLRRVRTVRRDHCSGPSSGSKYASTSSEKGDGARIGGLMANDGKGQGGIGTGRGVKTGDRQAKAPVSEVGERNRYAPGSLLDQFERHDGGPRPSIEREKSREVDAPIVEGL
ncbi:hypothetical protein MMC28_011599 [Mycoblastus sanguinarius]|nr:hypothetical protein [Mycoblastus sanguinarius]